MKNLCHTSPQVLPPGLRLRSKITRHAHLPAAAVTGGSLPASTSLRAERAARLQKICVQIERARVRTNLPLTTLVRRAARRWNKHPFRCNPSRRLAMSFPTLVRCWYLWWKGGRTPSVFQLHYGPGNRVITAKLLTRFVNFCAARPWPSLKAAWATFVKCKGAFGRGRRSTRRRLPTYDGVRYHLPLTTWRELQAPLTKIEAARRELAAVRLQICADMRERLPDRLPRRRGGSYEI